MSYADTILPEFDQEMASTRKVLERVPDDKLHWKAHPQMQTIGWNAGHLANIPTWVGITLTTSSLDVAPPGVEPPWPPSTRTWPTRGRRSLRQRMKTSANPGHCSAAVRRSSPCRGPP